MKKVCGTCSSYCALWGKIGQCSFWTRSTFLFNNNMPAKKSCCEEDPSCPAYFEAAWIEECKFNRFVPRLIFFGENSRLCTKLLNAGVNLQEWFEEHNSPKKLEEELDEDRWSGFVEWSQPNETESSISRPVRECSGRIF